SFEASLIACWGIVSLGYLAGRLGILEAATLSGFGTFIGRFALPALLFRTLAMLDFGQVELQLLLGILLAKVAVFFVVLALSMKLDHSGAAGAAGVASRGAVLGMSALRAIFCTQSNDFALGLPI
ncbi:hypothetical protein M885DRAFT_426266, partial [Pelagophyceae sp. CCMP2097]